MRVLIGGIAQFLGIKGGMERVIVNFANEMAQRGHNVSIVYCTDVKEKVPYFLNPTVKLINLSNYGAPGNKLKAQKKPIAFKVHREIIRLFKGNEDVRDLNSQFFLNQYKSAAEKVLRDNKFDIFISIDSRTTAVFEKETMKQGIPLITMTHVNAEKVLSWMSKTEIKAVEICDTLQVLMPHDIKVFRNIYSNLPIVWIPNIVPQYEEGILEEKLPVIVDVARLGKEQKRQHLLLEAFAKISDEFPQWNLELWGEEQNGNTYTQELKNFIENHHLQGRVKLCGNTKNVLSVYHRSSIFVFPSAYEGFGLALTEAMSAGLPVVAYRSCPAVNELVKDGENGILVEDGPDALAEGLKILMRNRKLREQMGKAAHESMKKFASERIWDQWETLMKDVIARH